MIQGRLVLSPIPLHKWDRADIRSDQSNADFFKRFSHGNLFWRMYRKCDLDTDIRTRTGTGKIEARRGIYILERVHKAYQLMAVTTSQISEGVRSPLPHTIYRIVQLAGRFIFTFIFEDRL